MAILNREPKTIQSETAMTRSKKLLSPGRQLLAIPQVEAAHAVDFQVAVILLQKQQENLKKLEWSLMQSVSKHVSCGLFIAAFDVILKNCSTNKLLVR